MLVKPRWATQEQRALSEFDSYLYGRFGHGWDAVKIHDLQQRAEKALIEARKVLDPNAKITIGHFDSQAELDRFFK